MKNPKPIFAAILAIVFCFAGFNLWNYFQGQQANEQLKDREAHERSLAREDSKQAEIAAQQAQSERDAAARAEKDRLAAIEREKREEAKRKDQADKDAKRAAYEAKAAERKQADLEQRIQTARTPRTIEGIDPDIIEQLGDVSARYIRENREEFLSQRFDNESFNSRRYTKLLGDNTNALMLYAAVSPDTDHIQALLDIGMDINDANDRGVTPLMFASAYNTAEVVEFMITSGANLKTRSGRISSMNALHAAAMLNPKPDVVETLVKAGIAVDTNTEDDLTPLILAATKIRNLEVVERLAKLGADKEAYDQDGKTALALVKYRRDGNGDEYYRISDEAEKQVLIKLLNN